MDVQRAGVCQRKNYQTYNVCVIKIGLEYACTFYAGLKLVNAYGQKGLCNKHEAVRRLIAVKESEIKPADVVANVFSFIGRSALGSTRK